MRELAEGSWDWDAKCEKCEHKAGEHRSLGKGACRMCITCKKFKQLKVKGSGKKKAK